MPNTQIVGANKAYGLHELNQWISEQEQILGPIVDIADGGVATAGEFDLYEPRVKTKFARVALKVGAACVLDDDLELITEGQAYLSGVLMDVCLARPK